MSITNLEDTLTPRQYTEMELISEVSNILRNLVQSKGADCAPYINLINNRCQICPIHKMLCNWGSDYSRYKAALYLVPENELL